ncbi:MAG: hypothetical protein JWP02_2365 [Acidimicrobiales bacterium]|nr:hypothetical protein [Acidimicrobiales bacterium]
MFTDDFLQERSGDCVKTLANWNIGTNGNIDVVASWAGSSGQVVDLDGSPNNCGGDGVPPISLKTPITLIAGRTYTASFKISTNPSPFHPGGQAADVNTMTVNFGPASGTFTKQPTDNTSFTTETLSFVAASAGTAPLTFQMVGPSDRGGIILDRVDVFESCA